MWEYIKSQDLQDPANKREIVCDAKLKELFGGLERVHMLKIGGLISPHFFNDDPASAAAPKKPKEPKTPKAPKEPKTPKAPKEPKTPKAPKEPKTAVEPN